MEGTKFSVYFPVLRKDNFIRYPYCVSLWPLPYFNYWKRWPIFRKVFMNIMRIKVNRRFGVTYSLYLHCRIVIQARNQHETERKQSCNCCLLRTGFLLSLLFNPEDGHDMFLWNVGWLPPDCRAWYPRGWKSAYSHLSMAPQSFVGHRQLFQFLNRIHSRLDTLYGGSARRKTATCTENNTNTE
jgi:hypothetical protein